MADEIFANRDIPLLLFRESDLFSPTSGGIFVKFVFELSSPKPLMLLAPSPPPWSDSENMNCFDDTVTFEVDGLMRLSLRPSKFPLVPSAAPKLKVLDAVLLLLITEAPLVPVVVVVTTLEKRLLV